MMTEIRSPGPFLSLSLRFAKEYLKQLRDLREAHGESKIQQDKKLAIYHRALWTALIVEIRKLFGKSFKEYKNFSLLEIDFFKSEPHKTTISQVFGDRTIQRILKTSNTFTVHLGQLNDVPLPVKDICESNLEVLLDSLQKPIDEFTRGS